jgi:trans-2,3-dihydro-3-hydroxyanthranilate isomerase
MTQSVCVYLADAFSFEGRGGSPTAVIFEAIGWRETQMKALAAQLPVSHTVFVPAGISDPGPLPVCFFTSTSELFNCGHGTIALHVVRARLLQLTGAHQITQLCKSGLQHIELVASGGETEVFLEQDPIQFKALGDLVLDKLLHALSLNKEDLPLHIEPIMASPGSFRILLALQSEDTLHALVPDVAMLMEVCMEAKCIGCFVYVLDTANGTASARMFAPVIGVNEDRVNGNSSGCLAAYCHTLGFSFPQLDVSQGKHLGQTGLVSVRLKERAGQLHPWIGGKARLQEEMRIDIPEGL